MSNNTKAIAHLAGKYFSKHDQNVALGKDVDKNQVIYNRDKSKNNQAEVAELNSRIYFKEIPKIKEELLNRYAEIKYDKYSNYDSKLKNIR